MIDSSSQAFPTGNGQCAGMSKREYFAARVLQGYCARAGMGTPQGNPSSSVIQYAVLAAMAVATADALIVELNKPRAGT